MCGMGKTLAQLQADWATHGRISALEYKLFAETDDAKRKVLEAQIAAERATITRDPD
jgi:hypothetical protein